MIKKFIFILIMLFVCSNSFAEGFGEKGITDDEIRLDEENVPEKQTFIAVDLLIGGGGFFSSGATNSAMLLSGQLAYSFKNRFRLGLGYSAKMHPLRDSRSLFQTLGPSFAVDIWRGFFVRLESGLAFAYIKNKGYQQSRTGIGWGLSVGYSYMFHDNIGLVVAGVANQRYIKQLYTDAGLLFGTSIRF